MEIRKADINDTGAIVRVALDTWKTETSTNNHTTNLPYRLWINTYRKSIIKDNVLVYVAENEKKQIIGFAAAGPVRFPNPIYRGELYAIYVLRHQQRKGIGSLLFKTILDRFKQSGIYSLIVVVLRNNPHKKFYEIHGGRKIDARTVGIKDLCGSLKVYGWQKAQFREAVSGSDFSHK